MGDHMITIGWGKHNVSTCASGNLCGLSLQSKTTGKISYSPGNCRYLDAVWILDICLDTDDKYENEVLLDEMPDRSERYRPKKTTWPTKDVHLFIGLTGIHFHTSVS